MSEPIPQSKSFGADLDVDRRDMRVLASIYLDTVRCAGGRVILRGFCCPHCDSTRPSKECDGVVPPVRIEYTKEKRS